MYNLFVYGTLKKGFHNHYYLEHSKFLGEALTVSPYVLYITGLPYVARDREICRIQGELYEVEENTLKRIDRLEGHPTFYEREEIKVEIVKENRIVPAWIYFINPLLVPTGEICWDGRYERTVPYYQTYKEIYKSKS